MTKGKKKDKKVGKGKIIYNNQAIEDTEDKIYDGKSFKPVDGVKGVEIVGFHLSETKTGNKSIFLDLKIDGEKRNDRNYHCFTSQKGCKKGQLKVTYSKNGKEHYLPTYNMLNSLTLQTVGKSFKYILDNMVNKKIEVFNFKKGKYQIEKVETFPKIIGKKCFIGFEKIIEQSYKDPTQFYTNSQISKVFDSKKRTRAEVEAKQKKGKFWKDWHENEVNKEPRDTTKGAYAKHLKKTKGKKKDKKVGKKTSL